MEGHASEKYAMEKLNTLHSVNNFDFVCFNLVRAWLCTFFNLQVEPIVQRGNELNVHHIILYQCVSNVTVSAKHSNLLPDILDKMRMLIVYNLALTMFLPLRWRCGECAVHHERNVREEHHLHIRGANKQQ